MSFGQNKMRAKRAELAPSVKTSDHRGMEWIVITEAGFYYGTESARGPGNETFCTMLAQVADHFKPWAKKLLRDYDNTKGQNPVVAASQSSLDNLCSAFQRK